jgi:succinate dehydrogenase / fumarate reductase iron-sulfur subunit
VSPTKNFTLRIWRQTSSKTNGHFVSYSVQGISDDTSLLETLDILNDSLIKQGKEPISFESDCREGICGACSLVINGVAHGPDRGTTACQIHMRRFKDGESITIEPWRARAFPIVKDLVVDRSAFDRVIAAGGYISVNTGSPQDANCIPIAKHESEKAFDAAACIGCGACVAACKNASAMLFVAAKVSHLLHVPQGHAEREKRVQSMVMQMEKEGFGSCSNTLECEAVCPKEISTRTIAEMNAEYLRSKVFR